MSRTLSQPLPISNLQLDDVQHFVLEDASWELYEKLLRDIGERPIRVTYDDGRMEIMSPLPEHERRKTILGYIILALSIELNLSVVSLGSTTFRRKDKAKGLEPDQCFYFRNESKMRGRKRLDLRKDPAPELVVEIDIASPSVPREPIYAALGVPEIWRFDGLKLHCLQLIDGEYRERKNSLAFPLLEPARLQPFLDKMTEEDDATILQEFVAWVRKQGWNATK